MALGWRAFRLSCLFSFPRGPAAAGAAAAAAPCTVWHKATEDGERSTNSRSTRSLLAEAGLERAGKSQVSGALNWQAPAPPYPLNRCRPSLVPLLGRRAAHEDTITALTPALPLPAGALRRAASSLGIACWAWARLPPLILPRQARQMHNGLHAE